MFVYNKLEVGGTAFWVLLTQANKLEALAVQ